MSKGSKVSDSDATARSCGRMKRSNVGRAKATPETSKKAGKHSAVEKSTASRPESGPAPGARPKPGTFGEGRSEAAGPKGLGGRPGDVSTKVSKTKGSIKQTA